MACMQCSLSLRRQATDLKKSVGFHVTHFVYVAVVFTDRNMIDDGHSIRTNFVRPWTRPRTKNWA